MLTLLTPKVLILLCSPLHNYFAENGGILPCLIECELYALGIGQYVKHQTHSTDDTTPHISPTKYSITELLLRPKRLGPAPTGRGPIMC